MSDGSPHLDVVFDALAERRRRRILEILSEDERPVKDLVAALPISQPAVSQHLEVLRRAGLVTWRRAGRERRYRIEPARLKDVVAWVERYGGFWEDRLRALGRHLDETE